MFTLIFSSLALVAVLYVIFRLIVPIKLPRPWQLVAIIVAVLVCSSPAVFMNVRYIKAEWADVLIPISSIGVAVASFLFTYTIIKDLVLLFGFIVKKLNKSKTSAPPTRGLYSAYFVVAATIISTVFGYVRSQNPVVTQLSIKVDSLPSELVGLRIIQISDLHITNYTTDKWMAKVVDEVNSLRGDLVVVTGDLSDLRLPDTNNKLAPLSQLKAKYGSYFVTGNHAYYGGQSRELVVKIENLFVTCLDNNSVIIPHNGKNILLGGVIDNQARAFGQADPNFEMAIWGDSVADLSILLAHQPHNITEASKVGFDIQLSGHTHNGQFFPWNFIVGAVQEYSKGYYKVGNTHLYVNQGTGYWGIPMKLGSTPEITEITLTN